MVGTDASFPEVLSSCYGLPFTAALHPMQDISAPSCSQHRQRRGTPILLAPPSRTFELPAHPGLIIKDSYWRWPQRNLAGNTIDFPGSWPDLPQRNARNHCGVVGATGKHENGRCRRNHATPTWPQLSVE
jgi:hypothetical protein